MRNFHICELTNGKYFYRWKNREYANDGKTSCDAKIALCMEK